MRGFLAAIICLFISGAALAQQAPVAERFYSLARGADYPGGDLGPIFDTSFAACTAACLNDPDCVGATFNRARNACFPKSEIGASEPFDLADSITVRQTAPGVLDRLPARVAALDFLSETDLSRARQQAGGLAQDHPAEHWTARQLLDAARDQRVAGDLRQAMRFTGAAITLTDDPNHWADYARLALAVDTPASRERRNLDQTALRAATNAVLRAEGGPQLALTLAVLAEALEANDRGRDMIPALRLGLENADMAALEEALDRAVRLYGFRVVSTEVESDAEAPRICAVFSEDLSESADMGAFLQTTTSGLSVQAEGRQFCITGVEHGARYEVTLRAGLPAASGETLRHPAALALYVRDRTPGVRFPGRAYVLPRAANGALPIVTVNTDAVDLSLHAITDRNVLRSLQEDYFGRPLNEWEIDRFTTELAETVWTGTGDVAMRLNEDVTTSLPMGEVLAGLEPGLYALEARIPGPVTRDQPPATQWFLVSDLGISAMTGEDGVHVFLRALSDTSALADMPVQLISGSNRVLATLQTDTQGYVHFPPDLAAGRGSTAPAMVAVDTGEDFAFLSLTEAEFDLSDRGVEGRAPAPAIDVFLTTERGAYRAGETIRATALARDGRAEAITGLPLTAILTRADGVEYARTLLEEAGAGGYVWAMPLGGNVPRGTWRLDVHADVDAAPLATQTLLVEDFLPERIDVALGLPDGPLPADASPVLEVQADYLFGAPASDLPIEGEIVIRPTATLEAHPGYSFGRHDDRPGAQFTSLPSGARTDQTGAAALPLDLPEITGVPHPRNLTVTARVSEGSGRPVERQITRPLAPTGTLLGLRQMFDGTLPEGAEAQFQAIAVGAEDVPVRWTLNRVERRYQWYTQNGSWYWEPVTTRTRIATGEAVAGSTPIDIAAPVDWGQFELRIETLDGPYSSSSIGFSAGWYGSGDSSGTPDLLEVSLDAESYTVGDTATLRIVPRSGGTALVRVVSNRLIDMQVVEVGDDPTEIALDVTEDWGAGAYVTATLLRPLDGLDARTPARALGLAHASVAPGDHALDLVMQAPNTAQPRDSFEVALSAQNLQPGDTVHASIAAVDLGILNLTGFEPPDPRGHYFGQRRLGVALRDLYGRIIETGGEPGQVRSGGGSALGMRMQAPPPTEALVAFQTGPLTVGDDGMIRARFDMPAFNGTVRVSAVAWSETGVGQATADVLVRDPVVVTASVPRFMATGDSARLLLEVTHAEGPTGEMPIEIAASGGLSLGTGLATVTLGDQETERLRIPLQAGDREGVEQITVTLTTPNGQRLARTLTLPVQVNDPVESATTRFTLAPGESYRFDAAVLAGYRPGSGQAVLSAGPLARFDAPGLLAMLDRYPYGCTEQLTSAAMPLLYMADVAETLELETATGLATRIQDAIDAILANQAGNGGFGLWGAYSGDPWLDAYVTDFLSRARAEGFEVPDLAFRAAIDNLRNQVATASDFENGGEAIAYALMVLAREGAAAMSDLRYYADVKVGDFATPLALGQLGAALAMYGDQPRADAMFRAGYALLRGQLTQSEETGWRADYGTRARDATGLLTLAAASSSDAIPLMDLARALPAPGRHVSTQEAAWSLMAANALIDQTSWSGLTLNGAAVDGLLLERLVAGDQTTRTVTNAGEREETLLLTTYGQAAGETQAGGNGYRIARRYVTMEGTPADPSEVSVGTRLVALITVTPFDDRRARLMVSDPLPAGFEIDNPNLLQGGDLPALEGIPVSNAAEHTEFRQDRFLAAIDGVNGASFTLGYIVRAVTPGQFHHPAASVEDMYRPQFRAQTASGTVVITE